MNSHLLCFSNRRFRVANAWLQQSARRFGIQHIHHVTDTDFARTEFYRSHPDIVSEPFGAGFYIWKPYYILETLKTIPEGDLLLYADSGQVLIDDPAPLFDICQQQGIVLFANTQGYAFFHNTSLPFSEYNCYTEINKTKYFTKGDAFFLTGLDGEKYTEAWLTDASILLFRNDEVSRQFVARWLQLCSDRRVISWDPNTTPRPNDPGFQFHIYDQSVLSLLAADMDIPLFRSPSQFGNHFKEPAFRVEGEYLALPYAVNPWKGSSYGTITHHHRYKRKPLSWRLKRFVYQELMMVNTQLLGCRFESINRLFRSPPWQVF